MKDNKLMAEFMGMTPCLTDEGDFLIKGNPIDAKYLPYDTSWDWLMPVLKKINLQLNPDNYNDWRMINKPTEYDIEDVYEQAVYFITDQNN
jgi:hypothetical protein